MFVRMAAALAIDPTGVAGRARNRRIDLVIHPEQR
jgi:hypothetical protein